LVVSVSAVDYLARLVCEITYYVLNWTINFAHSLTYLMT